MRFATQVLQASFANHICHVVLMCPGPQMVRINATTNIAFVQDVHPIRDWAIMDDVGSTMRPHMMVFGDCNDSITQVINATEKQVTPRKWNWLTKTFKPLLKRLHYFCISSRLSGINSFRHQYPHTSKPAWRAPGSFQ
jgi:hypothetical protein